MARVRISYRNAGTTPEFAELRVNGQTATRIAFPPTGTESTVRAVWIQALFDREGANNMLSFVPLSGPGLSIESIAVE
jgi:hypothetical protein